MQRITFGDRLRELRVENKMGQKEVGDLINVSYSTIGKYESNERTPDPDKLNKLADFFKVSVDYLLGRTDIKKNLTKQDWAFIMTHRPNAGKKTLLSKDLNIDEDKIVLNEIYDNLEPEDQKTIINMVKFLDSKRRTKEEKPGTDGGQ
jgi:transcriptional regulator with XRE-family HTH domain